MDGLQATFGADDTSLSGERTEEERGVTTGVAADSLMLEVYHASDTLKLDGAIRPDDKAGLLFGAVEMNVVLRLHRVATVDADRELLTAERVDGLDLAKNNVL